MDRTGHVLGLIARLNIEDRMARVTERQADALVSALEAALAAAASPGRPRTTPVRPPPGTCVPSRTTAPRSTTLQHDAELALDEWERAFKTQQEAAVTAATTAFPSSAVCPTRPGAATCA
ncbi:hypothetical protein ACFQ3Z_16105 [Streptomyces nogalater]